MEHQCGICHDRAAMFRCIQCHKPVCDDCAFKTEHGAFCSRECAGQYREFKRAQGPQKRRSSLAFLKPLLGLAIVAALVAAAAYKLRPEWFEALPWLGSN